MSRIAKAIRNNKGFTLIELLVVVVIIGILAAVALPSLLGQANKARTTEATSVLSGVNTGQESFITENQTYTTLGSITLPTLSTAPSTTQSLSPTASSGTNLVLTVAAVSAMSNLLGVNISNANWQYATAGNGSSWNAAAKGVLAPMVNLAGYTQKGLAKVLLDVDSTQ